jgi:capsular polysaccharide biosynthesis protein
VKETRLEEGLLGSNVRVVEEAVAPRYPARPNKPLNVAVGLLVSGLVGVGFVFFAEYMDDTVRNAREVEQLTGLTVIARIPLVASSRAAD